MKTDVLHKINIFFLLHWTSYDTKPITQSNKKFQQQIPGFALFYLCDEQQPPQFCEIDYLKWLKK